MEPNPPFAEQCGRVPRMPRVSHLQLLVCAWRLLREIEEDGNGLDSAVPVRGLRLGATAGGIEGIKSDLRDVNDKMHSHRVILDRMVPLHRLLGANTAVSEEVDNKYYELAERYASLISPRVRIV